MMQISHNDTDRWGAVLRRDAREDGRFVYAVRSTGVYCRPSCPSRRPRREMVVFFPEAEEAERAGFRPCLRCRPAEPPADMTVVEAVCRSIRENFDRKLPLAALARKAGYSSSHLQRMFRKTVGISPRQYADAVRLEAFKDG